MESGRAMENNPITLQDAIDHLYDVAVVKGRSTSPNRLLVLAEYCIQQLAVRGLRDARREVTIPGGARPKNWDVAWRAHGKYRLALSLKSILKNLEGTVPNRGDDLIGEVANVQMYSPEIVVGYVMIFNTAEDAFSKKHGSTWSNLIRKRLQNLSGRTAPSWSIGMVEASVVIDVDFSNSAILVTPETKILETLDLLVAEVRQRNPLLGEGEVTS